MRRLATQRPRLLIVDDTSEFHNYIHRVLKRATTTSGTILRQPMNSGGRMLADDQSFAVDDAYQGEIALQLVSQAVADDYPYDVAVVDMHMPPGWDGPRTIEQLWRVDRHLQIVLCTGYSGHDWEEITERLGNRDQLLIIKKPFDSAEILQAILALTEKRRLWEHSQSNIEALEATVQQRTEELRIAHYEAERLLSAISSVLVGIASDECVSRWNVAAELLFDIPAADALGKPFSALPIQWDSGNARQKFISTLRGIPVQQSELAFINRKGQRIILWASFNPVCDGQQVTGMLLLATNATQHRTLEQQLHQAQKLESVGQLAAGVAHEINTPLQYIGDNVSYLHSMFNRLAPLLQELTSLRSDNRAEDVVPRLAQAVESARLDKALANAPQAFQDVEDGIRQVSRIVKAMKEISHPGSDEPQRIDINHALESTVLVARNEWKYVAELEMDLDPNMPPLDGYAGELNQVFLNLLINSAHAISSVTSGGENGKGIIHIKTSHSNDMCEITIRDTGEGIPRAIHHKVFDPFFTTKEVGKGTGQGLAIAHQVIVKKHQGRIWFESEEGAGTTFYLQLPLERAQASDASMSHTVLLTK